MYQSLLHNIYKYKQMKRDIYKLIINKEMKRQGSSLIPNIEKSHEFGRYEYN